MIQQADQRLTKLGEMKQEEIRRQQMLELNSVNRENMKRE